jgi:Chaperone of endosialidase
MNTLDPTDSALVSGSSQITALLPSGVVSGSTQIDLTATTNYASGILSRLNVIGVISGSSQITAGSTTNFASDVKSQLNTNTVVSGSSQISIASTTGFGTYINQAVLTTSNVQINSLGVGMAASATAGRIDATNDVVAYSSSDRRFKTNIVQIGSPIQKIKEIGGYEFDWIPNTEHGYDGHDVGVIAQEIEAVIPELVQTRESGYKAVKYDKLVALLIEGIKEQQSTIEKLEARISKLEGGE